MPDLIIKNINHIYEMTNRYSSKNPIYRGVSNSSYNLISTFGRAMNENQIFRNRNPTFTFEINYAVEQEAIEIFMNEAVPHLSKPPVDRWEWIALAQHHGLPTRLLDWTTNPLVALFFATTQYKNPYSDSAIYVISDPTKIPKADRTISPFDIEEVYVYIPTHTTPRITAQSGLFTAHPNPEHDFQLEGIEKWIIPKDSVLHMRGILRTFGFNCFSLFPNLEGLAARIVNDYAMD